MTMPVPCSPRRAVVALAAVLGAAPLLHAEPPQATTGCTPAARTEALRTLQREVLAVVPARLESLDAAIAPSGPLAGWRLSHGHTILATAGAVAVDDIDAAPPTPPLLLYAPSRVDAGRPHGPYTLVGWGYLAPYRPGAGPPRRPCIAPGEWLVHEAGWHLADGRMLLTPGADTQPAPPPEPTHFWHPRAWDLHVWLGSDGTPTITYANPNASGAGIALPHGAFLRQDGNRLVPLPG